jgi:anaerobic magnesium-protoporphyrin IX monomethyl ester cyclase
MKILLMLPVMDMNRLWGRASKGAGNNNFNYGLASIASYLLQYGYDVQILDPQFLHGDDAFSRYLLEYRPHVVGITSYTPTITAAYETANQVRRTLPNSTIVIGGPHCSYFPSETLAECGAADYVIFREGEHTMLELVRMLDSKRHRAADILGLVHRKDGQIMVNAPRPFLDVNSLPLPAYHLFPLAKYTLQPTIYKRVPTLTTLVSRGCPYSCSFCHGFDVLGRKVRYREVENTLEELKLLMKVYGARGFMFYDSTFTFSRSWVVRFCEEIIRNKLDFTWMCMSRTDSVSEDVLALMRRAGCWGISFGVESANQKSLDLLKKGTTVEQNREAIRVAKKAGLYVTSTYMIGLPGEDEKDVLNTVEFAKANPTHIAHFFWPLPYPKTLFFDQCKADGGIMENPGWENFNIYAKHPVYVNPRLGYEKMRQLQETALRGYYTNWNVILMNFKTITTPTDVKKYFLAARAVLGQANLLKTAKP